VQVNLLPNFPTDDYSAAIIQLKNDRRQSSSSAYRFKGVGSQYNEMKKGFLAN
jgi:hypothetical protein